MPGIRNSADSSDVATEPTQPESGGPTSEPPVLDGLARTLLEVGRRTFVELGYHRASVAKIAEEAGVSVGLLYYHFGSKEGLFRAVWADYQRRQWQNTHYAVRLVKSAGISDKWMLFLAGTRAYLVSGWENRDVVRMTVDGDLPPGFAAESQKARQNWLVTNQRLLQLADDRTSRVLHEMASAAIGGALQAVARCESRTEAEDTIDVAVEVFARTIGYPAVSPEPGSLAAAPPSA